MDEIIKRLSERLSAHSSRRGFFSRMSKLALGAAAVLTGQNFFAQSAEAASLRCCTGTACATASCPRTAPYNLYTWSCGSFFCHDCYSSGTSCSGTYHCTYVARSGTIQHCP